MADLFTFFFKLEMDGNFRLCFIRRRSFRSGNEIIRAVGFDAGLP